jgi:hypothetical protein
MTKVIARQAQNIMNYREAVFVILVGAFMFSLVSYAYSVHHAITNVVMRESIVKDIQTRSTAVADLETKYFTLKNNVSIDLAHADGFKEAPVSMFISKKPAGSALSFNN